MPISNEHLKTTTQVWDGKTFSMIDADKAAKLEAAGTHQIATNRQATELLTAEQLRKKAAAARRKVKAATPAPHDPDPAKPATRARTTQKKKYTTREMKADN